MSFLTFISPYQYNSSLSGEELLLFAFFTLSIVLLLSIYYQKISNKYHKSIVSKESEPIYTYKNVLLQEISSNTKSIPMVAKTSMTLRVIAFVLIILVVTTPLYQLFNVNHFV